MNEDRERGDIVLGWLTRVVVALTLIGLIGFDAIAIGAAHFTASDHATEAATLASQSWESHHDADAAYSAATESAAGYGDRIAGSIRIDADGTVHLMLVHHATTLLLRHFGPLRHYEDVKSTVTVRADTP